MNIEEKLKARIIDALKNLDIEVEDVLLEHPTELSHGDFATNVALVAAQKAKMNPLDVATNIAKEIVRTSDEDIEDVEVAGPGFINFFLSKHFYKNTLRSIIQHGDSFGRNDTQKGKTIMVEYTDPNPFKAFHIGHLMSNTIGESISRLIEYSGATVERANYQGDVGMHVAKAVWALQEGVGSAESAEELGKAYAHGARMYEEGKRKEIDAINKAIYERSNCDINAVYEEGRAASLQYFETLYARLGTTFNHYFFESDTAKKGAEIVTQHTGSIFTESEGAVVFKGEAYDSKLHTRVFINSEGLPTYEAKELGLAYAKKEVCAFDSSITITANEIDTYFEVVKTALKQIDADFADKIQHVSHGMMKLPTGKMSSRTGEVISAEGLIDEVQEAVLTIESERDIADKEKNADQIAIAALKYIILRQAPRKDIVFDLKRSLSFEGDSGPYLQYAHTRAHSVLKKAHTSVENISENTKEMYDLEKLLYRFPEIVRDAQKYLEPHRVTTYLTELAGAFNSFYAREKIIDGDNEAYNLALVRAFQIILRNGLYLLGMKAPEKM